MTALLIQLLRWTHTLLLLFVLFGWLAPYRIVWLIHMIFIPLMILQWKLNNNACILTNLEHHLNKQLDNNPNEEEEEKFVRGLMLRIFGSAPSDHAVEIAIRVISWSCCILSVSRYNGWLNF